MLLFLAKVMLAALVAVAQVAVAVVVQVELVVMVLVTLVVQVELAHRVTPYGVLQLVQGKTYREHIIMLAVVVALLVPTHKAARQDMAAAVKAAAAQLITALQTQAAAGAI